MLQRLTWLVHVFDRYTKPCEKNSVGHNLGESCGLFRERKQPQTHDGCDLPSRAYSANLRHSIFCCLVKMWRAFGRAWLRNRSYAKKPRPLLAVPLSLSEAQISGASCTPQKLRMHPKYSDDAAARSTGALGDLCIWIGTSGPHCFAWDRCYTCDCERCGLFCPAPR